MALYLWYHSALKCRKATKQPQSPTQPLHFFKFNFKEQILQNYINFLREISLTGERERERERERESMNVYPLTNVVKVIIYHA